MLVCAMCAVRVLERLCVRVRVVHEIIRVCMESVGMHMRVHNMNHTENASSLVMLSLGFLEATRTQMTNAVVVMERSLQLVK